MHVMAMLDIRSGQLHVHVPALACGAPVPDRGGAEAAAAALITAATGVPASDLSITVRPVGDSDTTVPIPPTDVDVRHQDGTWHGARQSAWVRLRDGSWRALVCYVVDGVTWERAVRAASLRPRAVTTPPGPRPRAIVGA